MSILQYTFESECLKNNTQITVVLPDKPRELTPEQFYGNERKYKVLWLLHGTFGDHSDWTRKTNIEMYATERNLVVVMPSALNSNYSNWNNYMLGYKMYDFLTEELMPLIYGWLPVSDKREDNFIAGLSMGGRGTIKYAVNHPEKFAAAAVLSATPMDMSSMGPDNEFPMLNTNNERMRATLANAGGVEAFLNSNENVWAIIDKLANTGKLPRLMFACGQEDTMLYEYYKKFEKHAQEIGLEAHWFELAGYKHEWRFWDLAIQEALDFFGIEESGGNPY
jgi:putative tributyrin esterase